MVYIQPNTTIKILRNVPLDNTYRNTLYFSSREQQYATFTSQVYDFVKYTIDKHSYQRHSNNSIKVEIWPEDLHDCNYLMFNNTSFGTKWFYAFIVNTEYVNNKTAIIYYEIDVMQTWLAGVDYELPDTFVEREHSATDVIGENTLHEDVDLGDYITTTENFLFSKDLHIYMAATTDYPETPTDDLIWEDKYSPGMLGNTPNALYIFDYGKLNGENLARLGKFLDVMQNISVVTGALNKFSINSIVSIYCAPYDLIVNERGASYTGPAVHDLPKRQLAAEVKNNKLFTYPYCSCICSGGGAVKTWKYELFEETPPSANFRATFGQPNTEVVVTPEKYNGEDNAWEESCTVKGWPVIPWVKDYFQNYLASTLVPTLLGAGVALVGGASVASLAAPGVLTPLVKNVWQGGRLVHGTGLTGAGVMAGYGVAGMVGNAQKQMSQAAMMPDTVNGQVDGSNTLAYHGYKGFHFMCRTLKADHLKSIDDYFTMFGYSTRRLKKPNIAVRPHWTFTKTIGFTLPKASIAAEYEILIGRIFDNGITFWNNPSEVGNYLLDNRV